MFSYFRNRRAKQKILREEKREELTATLAEWRELYKTTDRNPTWVDDRAMLSKSGLLPKLVELEGFTLEEIGTDHDEMNKWANPRSDEGKKLIEDLAAA